MYKSNIHLQTGFTRDEALALLLGLGDRRILPDDDPSIPDGIEVEYEFAFGIEEYLNDEFEFFEGEYKLAVHKQEPTDIITKKLEEFNKLKELISKAEKYALYFDDEISKGDLSAIRLDKSSSSFTPHYTLVSIHQWSINTLKFPDISIDSFLKENTKLAELPARDIEADKSQAQPQVRKRILKHREQEEAILTEIKKLGHNPMNLPLNNSGLDGVRANVRDALINDPLFMGSTIYDKAWERLSKFNLIAYKK